MIAKKDVALDWDKFALAFDSDPQLNVYENRRALPRAFVVGVQASPTTKPRGTPSRRRGSTPRRRRWWRELNLSLASSGRGDVTEVRAGRTADDRCDRRRPALLVVSQVWYPGWQVVDGRAQGGPCERTISSRACRWRRAITRSSCASHRRCGASGGCWRGLTLAVLLVGFLVGVRHRRQR